MTFPKSFIRAISYCLKHPLHYLTFLRFRKWTMVGPREYIDNLELAERIKNVPGSVIECGTWKGGMISGIASVLGRNRCYYLCDSFEGLPPAKEIDGADALAWQANRESPSYFDNCRASENDALTAIRKAGVDSYRLVKGWFSDTLPSINPEPIALLRMDADWYDSTCCILSTLAPKVVKGGLIVIDDYYTWEGCKRAIDEYVSQTGITLKTIGEVVYMEI